MLALRPMSDAGFAAYRERLIVDYAADKVRSGSWTEGSALGNSRDDFAKLLPQGLASPGQVLFDLVELPRQESVGELWIDVGSGKRPGVAYIYDLAIAEAHQGRGLGAAALALAEQEARRHGCNEMQLHVFGFNTRAIALYNKAGYSVVDMVMRKPL